MRPNLKYIPHVEIDFERWDRCVSGTAHPQPYGFSWYLNWVALTWDALVYGDYEVVFPLFPREKNGILFTTRPYGIQAAGPYSTIPLSAQWLEKLMEEAMEHFTYGEFFLSPGVALPSHWTSEKYSNFVLSTKALYKELAAGYSAQTKRNLKKAQKSKLEFAQWATAQDVVRLWKQNTQEKTHITSENIDSLKKILEFCLYQKRGILMAVYDEGNTLVAGQIWVQFRGRSTLLLNASSSYGKECGAPTLLIDQMIQLHAGSDHMLDFEGSSIPGLARFYSGFGAHDEPFYFHVENNLPWYLRWRKPKTTRS